MSNIEKVDVSKVKQNREATQKAQKVAEKIEASRDKKFKIRAMKQPLNKHAQFAPPPPAYEPQEYRIAPALALVEGVSRGLPQIAPADYERMKMRLLKSPDIQYLTEKVFMNYTVESDKLKLLLTILTHCANEVLTSATEQKKSGMNEALAPRSDQLPVMEPTPPGAQVPQGEVSDKTPPPKDSKSSCPMYSPLKAQESIAVPD